MSGLSHLRLSEDLSLPFQIAVLGLFLSTVVLLVLELRGHSARRWLLLLTGGLGSLVLTFAVLRPSRLTKQGQEVPGLAVALMDASERLSLPTSPGGETRSSVANDARARLSQKFSGSRVESLEFGKTQESDLLAALRKISAGTAERPQSIVVFSDGRLSRPGPAGKDEWQEALRAASGGIPVHTVQTSRQALDDRSIRKVGFTGSAVAHQPISLKLEIGCEPAIGCDKVEVVVRELLEGQGPSELARGETTGQGGIATLELDVTLERAGGRVVEVELIGDKPDDVPENDKRYLPVQVRRDRLRMLHVAGRPTYDVRALRMFLKSDESIDLVSFFILRTQSDQVNATSDELALIPFPVDELFSEHLRSFDAVILQDIDAPRYQLDRHFESLKRYVLGGGGLILVGGPTGFSSGGYAGSPVADVLPVELPLSGELITRKPFVPLYTPAGRAAPVLSHLRSTMGDNLPEMNGANYLGRPKPGALVLWSHPTLPEPGQSGGELMPVLSLSEVGDGRTIAISVDSTHQFRFGQMGAEVGGRAYADLWEGLLGWLMRDPRFEAAQLTPEGTCVAGQDQILRVEGSAASTDNLVVTLAQLGSVAAESRTLTEVEPAKDGAKRFLARGVAAGGYAARVKVGEAPPTRSVFACEPGGAAWADSRADTPRLRAISETTGGQAVSAEEVESLKPPQATFISVRQKSTPLLPPWIWASLAAALLSLHWFLRRTEGYV